MSRRLKTFLIGWRLLSSCSSFLLTLEGLEKKLFMQRSSRMIEHTALTLKAYSPRCFLATNKIHTLSYSSVMKHSKLVWKSLSHVSREEISLERGKNNFLESILERRRGRGQENFVSGETIGIHSRGFKPITSEARLGLLLLFNEKGLYNVFLKVCLRLFQSPICF